MNSNNPREQRAYQRRLQRLRARDRRWGAQSGRRLREINDTYEDELREERYALDDDRRSRRRLERQQEIDDGGLDV